MSLYLSIEQMAMAASLVVVAMALVILTLNLLLTKPQDKRLMVLKVKDVS